MTDGERRCARGSQTIADGFREFADLTRLTPPQAGALPPGLSDPAALARLAELAEHPDAALLARLAAGAVLAACGDPRLSTIPAVVGVPGGTVEIGLAPERVAAVSSRWRHVGVERAWIEKETPAHPILLDDFWIGRYPVTNGQYREFLMASDWAGRPSTWYLGAYPWDRANHPVCGIAAADADAYVRWLTEETGHPYRLPTEAEWEHAAKGNDGLEYPWGADFDSSKANTRETGIHTTTPVGVFPAGNSPFGVADMAGNVEEYVADRYQPYPGGRRVSDHLSDSLGDYRVTRGGSFARYGDLARTRRRHGPLPAALYPCGLRIASEVEPTSVR
jgi:formylglycine-generating enzyme required for sulfatase activity